ncbi:riboflavin synthase [Salinibacillus kushneri]|uniref:Riboflavin synthase n=1 Tax=Salinibacillus kushneri TaxID=237682 RepID=A0A1I0BBM0_9BACI|nr:riboflavin synthase [Salinibacillus kushneri]SET03937.1 riboflavin synthase [Salinibacillus kushneri]
MFTGIIEEVGTIKDIQKGYQEIAMMIEAPEILQDVSTGDSISVNGVCLTVTTYSGRDFQVDVMPETIKATSLRILEKGSKVNLERSMPANGRFGGHFVSGHVDGVGTIKRKKSIANAMYYYIEVPDELNKLMMLKGSVAIDGTSLTVFGIEDSILTISLIPHTVSHTILGEKGQGDIVNIECDMLAKYVSNMLPNQIPTNKG